MKKENIFSSIEYLMLFQFHSSINKKGKIMLKYIPPNSLPVFKRKEIKINCCEFFEKKNNSIRKEKNLKHNHQLTKR
jgi:hypothetical protein